MKPSVLSLVITGMLLVPAAGAHGATPETVAGFAIKITAALGAPAVDAPTAVAALRARGCRLDDPAAPLTEGAAAEIMAGLGLHVLPPADPSNPISPARATLLAALTGKTATTISPQDVNNLPTQCLSEKNQGQCVECCKTATNCDANALFACNVCSHFCKAVIPPPPSDSAPQP
jgi:hypothetical protein